MKNLLDFPDAHIKQVRPVGVTWPPLCSEGVPSFQGLYVGLSGFFVVLPWSKGYFEYTPPQEVQTMVCVNIQTNYRHDNNSQDWVWCCVCIIQLISSWLFLFIISSIPIFIKLSSGYFRLISIDTSYHQFQQLYHHNLN